MAGDQIRGLVSEQVAEAYERNNGNVQTTAQELGVTRSTVQYHLRKMGITKPLAGGQVQGSEHTKLPLPVVGKIKRYILTCAQNNTWVWDPVWDNMMALAEHYDADVLVSTFTYNKSAYGRLSVKRNTRTAADEDRDLWYDDRLMPYIDDGDRDLELAPGLVWCGRMNTLPTAVRPLQGFETYTGRRSGIFPHVKLAMASVPSGKYEATKFNYTTGTVSKMNYIQKTAGLKAEHHHVYGGLLVEVDHEGSWWVRQLQADKRGHIYDKTLLAADGAVTDGHQVEAISYGDVHAVAVDQGKRDATWGDGGMKDTLRPKHDFVHDLIDFRARNHHERKDPHRMFQRFVEGEDTVKGEMEVTRDLLMDYIVRDGCRTHVVDSNHDGAIARWLRECDYRQDPPNAVFFLHLQAAKYAAIEGQDKEFHLPEYALHSVGVPASVHFLREDESFVICRDKDGGIECAWHGHLGPDGTRGMPGNLYRIGRRANTAHTHKAGIYEGLFVAGTSSRLDMGWNPGPSSWSHSDVVTYPNGKRAIYTMWNGKMWAGK